MNTEQTNLPLVELARPKNLSEICLAPETKTTVTNLLKDKAGFPHLILTGPPGTGKTSLARIIAKDLLGKVTDFNYLELNASFDRGINTIREVLKNFVSRSAFMKIGSPETKYKVVFLDEACSLTNEAQWALKNLMESYVHTARFIFSCNNYSKMHDALISRSYTIKFNKTDKTTMYEHTKNFLDRAQITYDATALADLCETADGDFRKVYNYLNNTVGTPSETLDDVCKAIVRVLCFKDLRSYEIVKENILAIKEFKDLFFDRLLTYINEDFDKVRNKFYMFDRLARADTAVTMGANFGLQVMGFLSAMMNC